MIISDEELKQLVLKVKLIDEKKLEKIASFAKDSGTNLFDALIEKDVASDENLGILIADYLKIPYVVLSKISIPVISSSVALIKMTEMPPSSAILHYLRALIGKNYSFPKKVLSVLTSYLLKF